MSREGNVGRAANTFLVILNKKSGELNVKKIKNLTVKKGGKDV